LVANGRRPTAEERGHLGAGRGEPEDVVDEEEDVLPLVVAEVFGGRECGERDTKPRSRRLGHLAEDQRRLLDDARLFHLVVEVVALPRALPDPGEDRDTAVL